MGLLQLGHTWLPPRAHRGAAVQWELANAAPVCTLAAILSIAITLR